METSARDSGLLNEADRELIRGIAERSARENERERKELARRLKAAREEAARLAGLMARDPGLKRALLFGSAATGRGYRSDSDIDLAIEGGDLFACMAAAETSSFRVDVVELWRLPPGIRARVAEEGIVLYEKA